MAHKGHGHAKVPDRVRRAIAGDDRDPQLAELVNWFFKVAGGPRQVARLMYEEYAAARPGSLIRQRLLETILRALRVVNEKEAPAAELGLLTEEDLAAEAAELLERPDEEEETAGPAAAAAGGDAAAAGAARGAGAAPAAAGPAAADAGAAGQ